ncbi:MAG: Holliday junction branch migration DNA helicase RuvB [Acholeplasmatales bacterium]|jgi:Holliday junction DNA helicase RuvB|nr:Holliday junction branch migration DNA helicase RuvB [Acholeplasmatales bacterium]MBQ6784077.1 Holliday junction branch migration DNA helicase RuvB [Acholeplasmatales bacterium]
MESNNEERIVDPNIEPNEADSELSLRPQKLKEYIGQKEAKEMLDVYIKAALKRNESLDHVLLYGPPGLGKTTLAQIIANELGVNLKVISGPSIERSGDLASVLSTLEAGDVLFIDEIHRLPRYVEEVLYSAMEDYVLDIVVGKESQTRTIRVDLPPFTLVGATTRFGDLSAPLRDRFGVVLRLEYYSDDELKEIITRTAKVYDTKIDLEAVQELGMRSRGTPRIANRLFRRVRDFADVKNDGVISIDVCKEALKKLGIDNDGLDYTDYRYLKAIIETFKGGPVGVESLAATISEEVSTIEDVYEPYLLQEGYIKRSNRGRIATEKAYQKLGIKYYKGLFS